MKSTLRKTAAMLIALCLTVSACLLCAPVAGAEHYISETDRLRMGDLDQDGKVSSADARIALRASVNLDTIDSVLKMIADVDRDGKISSADARLILRASIGLEKVKELSPKKRIKVGLICLHDENSSYDERFMKGLNGACMNCGIPMADYYIKANIPEDRECFDAAEELVDEGCSLIIADSFGHEDFLIEAARRHPDVQFCQYAGVMAHTEGLSNYHNFYNAAYQGRFLTGVAAGLKLNQMIDEGWIRPWDAKLGFVGTYTYAEVVSAYTAFFLGARYVCPSVTMKVDFTGSWFDLEEEYRIANELIMDGCQVISQYSESFGAPIACEQAGVFNVPYNAETSLECPNTCLVGLGDSWLPYFTYAITCVQRGVPMAPDWTGELLNASMSLYDLNVSAAPGTDETLLAVFELLTYGKLHVFDTSAFTVGGERLDSYYADVDFDWLFEGDTQAVSGGYFHESEYRSAPYFDIQIDGIELLDTLF